MGSPFGKNRMTVLLPTPWGRVPYLQRISGALGDRTLHLSKIFDLQRRARSPNGFKTKNYNGFRISLFYIGALFH